MNKIFNWLNNIIDETIIVSYNYGLTVQKTLIAATNFVLHPVTLIIVGATIINHEINNST